MESTGIPYGDIIVIGAIAAFIILRYRAILGEKSGFDFSDSPRHTSADEEHTGDEKVIALPGRASKQEAPLPEHYKSFEGQINALKKEDATFDISEFMQGAQQAFEMVFNAFNDGDTQMLEMLLSEELEETFIEALTDRDEHKHVAKNALVSIKEPTLAAITLERSMAIIQVRFDSEQIHATYDEAGELLSGDPSRVMEVNDIWEFERNMRSGNPNWTIIDT